MQIDISWLNLTQIFIQLMACTACYMYGKHVGINGTISYFLERKIITERQLDRLEDDLD